jgi:hypothetical protein
MARLRQQQQLDAWYVNNDKVTGNLANQDNPLTFHDTIFIVLLITSMKTLNGICRLKNGPTPVDGEGTMVAPPGKIKEL